MAEEWVDAATFDRDLRNAVHDTENEIMNSATGSEEYSDRLPEDLWDVEGLDGEALPLTEVAHSNLFGRDDTGNDRPIQAKAEEELRADNIRLATSLKEHHEYIEQHIHAPQREAQLQQVREAARKKMEEYGLYDLEGNDAKTDLLLQNVIIHDQQVANLQAARINESMERARRQYGRDFDDTYADITSMNVNSPLAKEIVRSITEAADPGDAIMQWHGSHIVQGLGPSRQPPFMPHFNSPTPPRIQRESRARPGADMGGWGDREIESDVMNSVWD
jgi:hypothetical protein